MMYSSCFFHISSSLQSGRLDDDLLGGRDGQRTVGGDALGQFDRAVERFTGLGHAR